MHLPDFLIHVYVNVTTIVYTLVPHDCVHVQLAICNGDGIGKHEGLKLCMSYVHCTRTMLQRWQAREHGQCLLVVPADLKALKLLVGLGHMTEDSMVIGRCTLPDLSVLSETRPYEE